MSVSLNTSVSVCECRRRRRRRVCGTSVAAAHSFSLFAQVESTLLS